MRGGSLAGFRGDARGERPSRRGGGAAGGEVDKVDSQTGGKKDISTGGPTMRRSRWRDWYRKELVGDDFREKATKAARRTPDFPSRIFRLRKSGDEVSRADRDRRNPTLEAKTSIDQERARITLLTKSEIMSSA